MNKEINKLDKEQFFDLDQFFKIQFKGTYRYGTMGSFFWKIFKNPRNNGFVNAVHSDGKIIATTSITPKSLYVKQVEYNAAEIGDTFTDKQFQGKGLFSILANESIKMANDSGIKFIYGTPNNQSLPGYMKRTRFEIVDKFKITTYFIELRIDHILNSKIGRYFSSIFNILFTILFTIYNFLINFIYPADKSYNVEIIDSLNESWDLFWNEASTEWDIIFNRDYKSLNWRFFLNPEIYTFLVVKKSGKIVGYTVYRVINDDIQKQLIIADFLFLKQHSNAFNTCLKKIKKTAIKLNINSMRLWSDSSSLYHSILLKNGFLTSKKIPIICYMDGYNHLNDVKNIHFTMSDSDNV